MTADKHIEFVQQIIARMNANSFQLKTWAVTLAAGLFALSERSKPWFALLALIPIVLFWFMDAYYLKMETQYRHLYDDLCKNSGTPAYAQSKNFSLKLKDYTLPAVSMRGMLFSRTQFWIYVPLLITVGLVVAGLNIFGTAAAGTPPPPGK